MPLKIIVGRAILFLLFAGAGLWTGRLAVLAWRRRLAWKREGVAAEGEIVGFDERSSTDPSDVRKLYAPIVEFRIGADAPRRFTSSTALRPNPYREGQKVAVRYMRSDPADADLDGNTGGLLTLAVLLTFTVVFLGVSLLPIFMPAPTPR
jgi:hypothetical protein